MKKGDIVKGGFWDGAEVISVYSRGQAIADGVLVPTRDLTPDEPLFASQAGFQCEVALTSRLADLVIPNGREEDEQGQSTKGRLWDVLNMARMYRRGITDEGGTWLFPCIFAIANRPEFARRKCSKTFHLKAVLSAGDDSEPTVTLMFPDED